MRVLMEEPQCQQSKWEPPPHAGTAIASSADMALEHYCCHHVPQVVIFVVTPLNCGQEHCNSRLENSRHATLCWQLVGE